MELTNDFRVGVPVERAWDVLTDVERIAPCMPGAQLQEVEGDDYRGVVKVKVGPITAQYKGTATFVEQDEAGGKMVLQAEGRDTRGQGNAKATITATMTADGDGTAVSVVTDLTVTGRVAQFGRGVMADVSAKLLGQFVDCLESKLLAGDGGDAGSADAGAASSAGAGGSSGGHGPLDVASEGAAAAAAIDAAGDGASSVRKIDSAEAEPVDLLDAAGNPVVKRALPVVAGLTVLWLLSVFFRRRRRRRKAA
jgi:carbon monoxide dehydrogenase subunit G